MIQYHTSMSAVTSMQYTQSCMKCWKGEKPDRRVAVYTTRQAQIYWPNGSVGTETCLVKSLECGDCPEQVEVTVKV